LFSGHFFAFVPGALQALISAAFGGQFLRWEKCQFLAETLERCVHSGRF
jgi:hypothetical protein